MACLPNPHKLSILGNIWRATILPFSSSKYLYSWLRLSSLVDLSFDLYLSFFKQTETDNHSLSQSSHVSAVAFYNVIEILFLQLKFLFQANTASGIFQRDLEFGVGKEFYGQISRFSPQFVRIHRFFFFWSIK